MRTKNNPYKLCRSDKRPVRRMSPKKSPKKTGTPKMMSQSPPSASTSADNTQLYACYQCDNVYAGTEPLIRHQKDTHKNGPIFLLPQRVVEVMGTKDVAKIVEAFGDRLNILDDGTGCHGRVMLSVDVSDDDEWVTVNEGVSDSDVTMGEDTTIKGTGSGNTRRKRKSKKMSDKKERNASGTPKRKSGKKMEDTKSAENVGHVEDDSAVSPHGKAKGGESGSKAGSKTVRVKPSRKQHILKVELKLTNSSTQKTASPRAKLSQNLKKYVCWGCGVSYDEQYDIAQHRANCRGRTQPSCSDATPEGKHLQTVIGTVTELPSRLSVSAGSRRRSLPGLSCQHCGEWYMNRIQLQRHKSLCKREGADVLGFKCSGCSQAFALRYDQCMHVLNHCPSVLDDITGPNSFVLRKLRNIQEQTERERMNSQSSTSCNDNQMASANTLFCYDCGSHVSVQHFREHKLECYAKTRIMLTCLDCCKHFATRLELNEHKRTKHAGGRTMSCACGVVFKATSDFLQHLKDNPNHCLSRKVAPAKASDCVSSTKDILDAAERAVNSMKDADARKVAAHADVASFVTSIPSEKGKVCHVQVHTSAEGNAITNVTVQFQGQEPTTDDCASESVPVPTGNHVVGGQKPNQSMKKATDMSHIALPVVKESENNPLAALGLVRRPVLPTAAVNTQSNKSTNDISAWQRGLAAITSTPRQSSPANKHSIGRMHNIKKVILPGRKIGYLVPVSKTMNQQAAMAEAKQLLKRFSPQTQQKSPLVGSERAVTLASNDRDNTRMTSVLQEAKQVSCVPEPPNSASATRVSTLSTPPLLKTKSQTTMLGKATPPMAIPKSQAATPKSQITTVQKLTPKRGVAHTATKAQSHGSEEAATRTTSTQKSHSQTPEGQKNSPQTSALSHAATMVSASPTNTPKSESPAKKVNQPKYTLTPKGLPVELRYDQPKPVPETIVLRKLPPRTMARSSASKANLLQQQHRGSTVLSVGDIVADACAKVMGNKKRGGKVMSGVAASSSCDSFSARDSTETARLSLKRKRTEKTEGGDVDDSTNVSGAKRMCVIKSHYVGSNKPGNGAAVVVGTPRSRVSREDIRVTATTAGTATDDVLGTSVSRSLPTRSTKSVHVVDHDAARKTRSSSQVGCPSDDDAIPWLSPLSSPTKEVPLNGKSQTTSQCKTTTQSTTPRKTPHVKDVASTPSVCAGIPRLSPPLSSPTKEVPLNGKSQPTSQCKTTVQSMTKVKDAASTPSGDPDSQSSAPKPRANHPAGLMLIAPVNMDMIRCIRCDATFTRVREITAHRCDGRPVSVIVQAELKLGSPDGFHSPRGGSMMKLEQQGGEGQ